MNKKHPINRGDTSQLIVSTHSLKICVEQRQFEFQFVNENENPKAKIIPKKLKIIKMKMLLKFTFSFVLKKIPNNPHQNPS